MNEFRRLAVASGVALAAVSCAWICMQAVDTPLTAAALQQAVDASSGLASPTVPPAEALPPSLLLQPAELAVFTGKEGRPIYLAILGDVFDVTTGAKHYARGRSYAHFAGRDASRAFSTGESEGEGLTDDISGLSDEELTAVADWHGFFVKHETYTRVGHVVGRYYNELGQSQEAFPWSHLAERARKAEEEKQRFPGCNSKWSQEDGSVVWCTLKSGGVTRDWAGVPRLLASAGGKSRCVCVRRERSNAPELTPYKGCALDSERCQVLN